MVWARETPEIASPRKTTAARKNFLGKGILLLLGLEIGQPGTASEEYNSCAGKWAFPADFNQFFTNEFFTDEFHAPQATDETC